MLQTKGVTVDTIVSYETYLPEESKVKLMETMDKINIDVFIFTSPSTVKHFVEILGEKYKELLHKKWIASIGPVTENVLETYQIPVHISPSVYTINGLLDELETYFKTFE